jgi:hypothetical protein
MKDDNEAKALAGQVTVEMDEETHRRVLSEIQERYTGPLAQLPILQEIRADQIKAAQEHRGQYGRIADILGEQNNAVNRLSTDVAGLSVRTATIEIEQQKHAALLGQVKERQDGCAARISHGDDTTEIREIRSQLHKAVQRRSTPPRGIKIATIVEGSEPVAASWWSSVAGRAVLTALAALLVAIASALTTWATISPGPAPTSRQTPPMASPADSRTSADAAGPWRPRE